MTAPNTDTTSQRLCRRCAGDGWIIIEEHLGDGVYSPVEDVPCPRCKGTGKEDRS